MSLIEHRPKALWRVADEVRDGHFAGDNEGYGTREHPDQEQGSSNRFQEPGNAGQRADR